MKEKIGASIVVLAVGIIAFEFLGGADWLIKKAEAQVGTSVTVLCTNQNYDTSPYCQAEPAYFTVNEEGEAYGVLTSGAEFSQTNVVNEVTRLQRFQVEKAFWYVSDRGVIHAKSDLQALSIYLYAR